MIELYVGEVEKVDDDVEKRSLLHTHITRVGDLEECYIKAMGILCNAQ